MPNQDELSARVSFFRREQHPSPLRADFYEGDKFTNGWMPYDAHSAILGVNNVTHSKGVIAGAIDNIPDVGVGGRSDANLMLAQVFIVKALIMKPYMQKHNRMKPLQLPPIK